MRLADIYCQPNLEGEPFGIAIAEAMRAAIAVRGLGGGRRRGTARRQLRRHDRSRATRRASPMRCSGSPPMPGCARHMGRAAKLARRSCTDPAGRLEELAAVLSAPAVMSPGVSSLVCLTTSAAMRRRGDEPADAARGAAAAGAGRAITVVTPASGPLSRTLPGARRRASSRCRIRAALTALGETAATAARPEST